MAIIIWNDDLSVRINSMDDQHKKLIDLINDFYKNIHQDLSQEKNLKLIEAMKNYTIYHFAAEEKLMKQAGYPDFDNHKAEHEKFICAVVDFEDRYKSGKLLLTLEITSFIKKWILEHIKVVDQQYSQFIVDRVPV